MDTWVDQLNRRAQLLMDQVIAARMAGQQSGQELGWLEQQYRDMIEKLYAEEYASARLRDSSDLVVRAEGPGADHDAPSLRSFNWLAEHVRKQLTKLGEAVMPLAVNDARAIARKLGWVFTGYAPGSIMMGFALRKPEATPGFEESDEAAFSMLNNAAQSIAAVPQFVGDNELNAEIAEELTDPALRDAAIVAAWQLSPTAQSGIHTIEVASRNGYHGHLSQRERMVLKQSVDKPMLRRMEQGSFSGQLRAADLDKHRVVLREVDGIGSIRCVIAPHLDVSTQQLFGHRVKVIGSYETDREGRPRMMQVQSIEPLPGIESLL